MDTARPGRRDRAQADDLRKLKASTSTAAKMICLTCCTGARRFVRRLNELGVPQRYAEFSDNHIGVDYRMDESLPFLALALSG